MRDLPSGISTWLGNSRPGGFHMKINGDCLLPGFMDGICWSFTRSRMIWVQNQLCFCSPNEDMMWLKKQNMISTMCRYCYKGNNRNPPCVGDVTRETIGFFTTMFVFLKGIHNIRQHVKIIHVWLYRWLKWMSHFSGKCLAWKNHPKTSRVEGWMATRKSYYPLVN